MSENLNIHLPSYGNARLCHSLFFLFHFLSVFCMSLQICLILILFENIKNHFELLHNFVSILGNQG